MTASERFILIGCLLQGALSREWAIWMPQSIEALSGSCVLIPCRFQIPSEWESKLINPAEGIWRKGGKMPENDVYDSGKAQPQNKIKGNITGDLLKKSCTTILNNVLSNASDEYYFRLECPNDLKWIFEPSVQINVQDSPPKPKLTPVKVEVTEGSSVSLSCSAAAPCPTLPPTLTWTPRLSDSEDQLQENQDQTKSVSSVLTFTASHLHHGQKITCTALYKLQKGDTQKTSEASLTLSVLHPPKNTSVSVSPSGSVLQGSSVTLTCSSNANPPVQSYTWYKVNGTEMNTVGTGQNLTFSVTKPSDSGQYYCEAQNEHGMEKSLTAQLEVKWAERGEWAIWMPQSIEALSGSCVLIPCRFQLKTEWESKLIEPAKGIWMKGGKGDKYTVFNSSKTQSENSIQGNMTGDLLKKSCTTILNNVPSNGSDKYYFRLECPNTLKWNFNTSVQINVTVSPPKPKLTPVKVEVTEGSSVTLSCSAAAPCPTLPPTLTWTPRLSDSEDQLQENQDQTNYVSSVLTFNASHLHHGQKITCTALYRLQQGDTQKTSEASLTLSVLYSPKNTSVSVSGPMLEGSSVTLTCSSNANPPVQSYTWYKVNGTEMNTAWTGQNLTFSVTKASDSGQYYCEAQNEHGKERSPTALLEMNYPPKNTELSVSPSGPVLEGSSVTLTCSSNANPPVQNYTWYKANGTEMNTVGNGQNLTFNVTPSDSGQYYCEAQNQHGKENSATALLDVTYPPKNTSVSVSPSDPVLEGSSVTLTCSSHANPPVQNYTWYKVNGTEMNTVGTGHNFTFNVTPSDSEQFYCKAQNEYGMENSTTARLQVEHSPKDSSVLFTPSGSVLEGSSVNLTCSSNANPPVQSYTWYKVNGTEMNTVGTGQKLTFSVTKPRDSGQYYCEAQNRHGMENSTTALLDVMFVPQISGSGSCSRTAAEISCSCESRGNPSPSMEWRVSGLRVTNSTDRVIREEQLGNTGLRSSLTMRHSQGDTPTLLCLSTNTVGNSSLQLLVPQTGFSALSLGVLFIGMLVGVSVTSILCGLARKVFSQRKLKEPPASQVPINMTDQAQPSNETAEETGPMQADEERPTLPLTAPTTEEDPIYANHTMATAKPKEMEQKEPDPQEKPGTEAQNTAESDTLQYASVKFSVRRNDPEPPTPTQGNLKPSSTLRETHKSDSADPKPPSKPGQEGHGGAASPEPEAVYAQVMVKRKTKKVKAEEKQQGEGEGAGPVSYLEEEQSVLRKSNKKTRSMAQEEMNSLYVEMGKGKDTEGEAESEYANVVFKKKDGKP